MRRARGWDEPSVTLSAGPIFSRRAEGDNPQLVGPVRRVGFGIPVQREPVHDAAESPAEFLARYLQAVAR